MAEEKEDKKPSGLNKDGFVPGQELTEAELAEYIAKQKK